MRILTAAFCLAAAASLQANQSYSWDNGAPGYSGTIVLDSNNNNNGSLADIVSITVTDPVGTFTLDQSNIGSVYIFGPPDFSWTPSQITGMWIDWNTDNIGDVAGVGENYNNSGGNFLGSEYPYSVDGTGEWLASSSAPDTASTMLLVGSAFTGMAIARRFIRRG